MSNKLIFAVLLVCFLVCTIEAVPFMNAACQLCEKVVDAIKSCPKTDQMAQQLKDLCALASDAEMVKKCQNNIDMVISELHNKTSEQICKDLKLC